MTTPMLDGPRLEPEGEVKRLVVFCHGYGANGQDLIGIGAHWRASFPDTAFVSPNAPEGVPGFPGGYQWFAIQPDRVREEYIEEGVRRAAPALEAFLDAELQRYGLDESALALVGFSQGTMMSLHVGLRRQIAPAAIIGYSGMLAAAAKLEAEATASPPVLLVHGDADPVIPHQATLAAAEALQGAGLTVQHHISPGTPHGIGPDGLQLGGEFLKAALAGDAF
ncbi:MAG: prolyl oligopeptidase family serine peptidase [Pseudomonadota bacterium]